MNYLERFDKVTEAKCKKMKSFKNVALTNIASGRVHTNAAGDLVANMPMTRKQLVNVLKSNGLTEAGVSTFLGNKTEEILASINNIKLDAQSLNNVLQANPSVLQGFATPQGRIQQRYSGSGIATNYVAPFQQTESSEINLVLSPDDMVRFTMMPQQATAFQEMQLEEADYPYPNESEGYNRMTSVLGRNILLGRTNAAEPSSSRTNVVSFPNTPIRRPLFGHSMITRAQAAPVYAEVEEEDSD
jgi:hypothetical protein